MRVYKLFVRKSYEINGIAYPETKLLCQGERHHVVSAYKFAKLQSEYIDKECQFWVEHDNFIIAIQVWGELLWLCRVPKPNYFKPPKRFESSGMRLPAAIQDKIDADRIVPNLQDIDMSALTAIQKGAGFSLSQGS